MLILFPETKGGNPLLDPLLLIFSKLLLVSIPEFLVSVKKLLVWIFLLLVIFDKLSINVPVPFELRAELEKFKCLIA